MDTKIRTMEPAESVSIFRSSRAIIYLMMQIACTLQYALRFSLNMSIVCMVIPPELLTNITDIDSNSTVMDNYINNTFDLLDTQDTKESKCQPVLTDKQAFGYKGEFTWSRSQVGSVLASFFYSYILTQVLAGWLADKYGFKHVLGTGTLVGALLSLLTPMAARLHPGALIGVRVLMGFALGVTFPSIYSSMGKWVPRNERIVFVSFVFCGPALGVILAFILSGYLCQFGWPLVFYILGAASIVWYIVFLFTVHSTPAEHPRITSEEAAYITDQTVLPEKNIKVPWRSIFTSPAVIGICASHFSTGWLAYSVNTGIPLYMQDVLRFNIKSNGVLSSLPSIISLSCSLPIGLIGEAVHKHLIKSRLAMRRTCQTCFVVGATVSIVAVGFMDCEWRNVAVFLFCMIFFCKTFVRGGSSCSPTDMAPRMSGSVYGVMNFAGNFSGFLAPLAIGNLTPTGSQAEWQRIFFLAGGICLAGWLAFVCFVKADEMDWAKVAPATVECDVFMEEEHEQEKEATFDKGEEVVSMKVNEKV